MLFLFARHNIHSNQRPSHHQCRARPHHGRHRDIHAGLDTWVVDEPVHFLRHGISIVYHQPDDFLASDIPFQRFGLPDGI